MGGRCNIAYGKGGTMGEREEIKGLDNIRKVKEERVRRKDVRCPGPDYDIVVP